VHIIVYIILGILQGFTEPLPISSSGHVVIFRNLMDTISISDLNFEIIVNFGSLVAVIWYFRENLRNIITSFINYLKTKDKSLKNEYNYAWLIIIGTIPAAILGLFFKDLVDSSLNNLKIIGQALIITAIFLYLIRNLKGKKGDDNITWLDALIVGMFQAVALFPGISRSGATIVGGMFRDFKRETAFKYSFLLYIPISIATTILGISDLLKSDNLNQLVLPYTLGMISATLVTYYALRWFEDIIKKGKLIYFVYYCLIVGIFVILFL
jgi:undecaprenyl-diphosphatase